MRNILPGSEQRIECAHLARRSRALDQHTHTRLFAQLCASAHLHDIAQQSRRHRRVVLVRPPRKRHRRSRASLACSCHHEKFNPNYVQLAARVLDHAIYFQERLRTSLAASSIPPHILSLPAHLQKPSNTQLPTPIIPLLTPRARALSAHLLAHGINARPISWPTVPKGTDRVRVCLHAGNTHAELDMLIDTAIAWAAAIAREEMVGKDSVRYHIQEDVRAIGAGGGAFLQSKL